MSSTATTILAVGLAVVALSIVAVIVGADIAGRRDEPPIATPYTPRRTAARHVHRGDRQLSALWLHAAPPQPFSPEQAHREMQAHLDCLLGECPRKRAAHSALVAAGHLTPARTRVRP